MLTVAAMTVTGIGGGAVAGFANMPHAAASSDPVFYAAPPVVARHSVATTSTTLAPVVHAAPTTTVPPVVHPAPVPKPAPAPAPKPASKPAPVPEKTAVASALQTRSQTPAAPAVNTANTCGAALAYLEANSAPGFTFQCPGYALGHQAMTCVNVSGVCPGEKLIVISTVCQASYMNEAHNSWVVTGMRSGSIDPYGYCH